MVRKVVMFGLEVVTIISETVQVMVRNQ